MRKKHGVATPEETRLMNEWQARHDAAMKDHALRRQREASGLPDKDFSVHRLNGDPVPST
jgi:hypothetical protein